MTVALAQFLTVTRPDGTIQRKTQNHFINETKDGHTFEAFNVQSIVSLVSSGAESLAVDFPPSETVVQVIEEGLKRIYIAKVDLYQYVPSTGWAASKVKIASFTGEFMSADLSAARASLIIGANLDSVEAQVPPRRYTTALTGTPPRL